MKKQKIILFVIAVLIFVGGIWHLDEQNKRRHEESKEFYKDVGLSLSGQHKSINLIEMDVSSIQMDVSSMDSTLGDLDYRIDY